MESPTLPRNCEPHAVDPLSGATSTPISPEVSIDSRLRVEIKEAIDSQVSNHEHQREDGIPHASVETRTCSAPQLDTAVDGKVDTSAGHERTFLLTHADMSVKRHALYFTVGTLHDDEDPRHVGWMMANILDDYLQPNTKLSVVEAANCFDSIIPDNRPNTTNDPAGERERAENWLWGFAEIIWDFAKQIPHDHESQDKIVHLLEALNSLPFTQVFEGKHFWASKLFGWEDPSRWAVADSRPCRDSPSGMTRQQQCDVYLNAMAFTARCAAIDWPHYDLIIDTLDEPLGPDYPNKSCDGLAPEFTYVHVAAAAQWILHGGEWLWGQIRWGKNQGLGSTKRSLPPSQWVAWMQGYYNMETKHETTRFWADVLARKMEMIMIARGYTAEVMENWDPEKQTVHDGIQDDPRYAHLFHTPG